MADKISFAVVKCGPEYPNIDISHDAKRPWIVVKLINDRIVGPVSRHTNHADADRNKSFKIKKIALQGNK